MKVVFFYRCPNYFYSIERVFDTVRGSLNKYINTEKKCVFYSRITLLNVLKNIFFVYSSRGLINHITGDIHYCSILLPKKSTILTIHDLVSIEKNKGLKKMIVKCFWFYIPLRHLTYVTCISNYTKKSLVYYFPWAIDKIQVIYNPISPDYKFVYKTFNFHRPVILHVGTRENKNLNRVIKALNEISCHLRIIGEVDNRTIELLKDNNIDYSITKKLSDEEIIIEYINCDILSFPSLYEGFGMPIIEAQATGRVVLTSNIEPLIEVSNNSSFLVDPYSIDSIKKGFIELISNHELRENLIKLGLKNVERFQPDNISTQYLQLYSELCQHSSK